MGKDLLRIGGKIRLRERATVLTGKGASEALHEGDGTVTRRSPLADGYDPPSYALGKGANGEVSWGFVAEHLFDRA